MAEQVLASRLKMIKDNVYAKLAKGEIEIGDYYGMIDGMLSEESFYKSASKNDRMSMYIQVAISLEPKLGLTEPWGLQKRYIARKDVPLSEAAQKDLDEFKRLKDSAKAYVESAFGDKPFTERELSNKIREHLMNYDWSFNPKPKDIDTTTGRLSVTIPLEMERKTVNEKKIICGYDEDMLNKVLHEI